jgi:hypothetical protein
VSYDASPLCKLPELNLLKPFLGQKLTDLARFDVLLKASSFKGNEDLSKFGGIGRRHAWELANHQNI